jgi:Ca-activated chloride channel family protein
MRASLSSALRLLLVCSLSWLLIAGDTSASSAAPLMGVSGSTERLPLLMTRVDAQIAGVTADVTLTQTYQNRGTSPIEAVYRFPARARAAVHAMSLKVGNRVVVAELQAKDQARKTYAEATSQGRTTALLEKSDADVLSISVANVLPGEIVEVEIRYNEVLVPDTGVYRFEFPNTFGDLRSVAEGSGQGPDSLTSEDEAVDFALDIRVRLNAPLPIQRVATPSHETSIERSADGAVLVQLSERDRRAAARDFRLEYSLAGGEIQTGALFHQEAGEGWFLLMMEPPARPSISSIVPREYIFVVDVSGSMAGHPLDTTKALMRDLVKGLAAHERFNVLLFESQVSPLALGESLKPTDENLDQAIDALDSNFGHGDTRLIAALEAAYALPATPGFARTLVVITDGHVAAGAEVSRMISGRLDQANVFAFGIGAGVSDQVIEQIARAGRGSAFFVRGKDETQAEAARLRQYVSQPLMTGVRLRFEGVEVFDLEPPTVPDVFAERPVVVTGRYRGTPEGLVHLTAWNGQGPHRETLRFELADGRSDHPSIKRFWAMERLNAMADRGNDETGVGVDTHQDHRIELERHALDYGLLSPWTSFVAVHEEIRSDGTRERVEQPSIRRDSDSIAFAGVGLALPRIPTGAGQLKRRASVGAAAMPTLPPPKVPGQELQWRDQRWTSAAWHPRMKMLRIRPGGRAALRVLELLPELRAAFDHPEPVLIVIGDTALLISRDGFSDYPEHVLRALAQHDTPEQG